MSIAAIQSALDTWGFKDRVDVWAREAPEALSEAIAPAGGFTPPITPTPALLKSYVWTVVDSGASAADVDDVIRRHLVDTLKRPDLFAALRTPPSPADAAFIAEPPEADVARNSMSGSEVAAALFRLSGARAQPELALKVAALRGAAIVAELRQSKATAMYDRHGHPNFSESRPVSELHREMHRAKALGSAAEGLITFLGQSPDPLVTKFTDELRSAWATVEDRMRVRWR